jgi:hypothetical protein
MTIKLCNPCIMKSFRSGAIVFHDNASGHRNPFASLNVICLVTGFNHNQGVVGIAGDRFKFWRRDVLELLSRRRDPRHWLKSKPDATTGFYE